MVEWDSCKTACQVNLALTVNRPNQAWREANEIHAKQQQQQQKQIWDRNPKQTETRQPGLEHDYVFSSATENAPRERGERCLIFKGRGTWKLILFVPSVHRVEELKTERRIKLTPTQST